MGALVPRQIENQLSNRLGLCVQVHPAAACVNFYNDLRPSRFGSKVSSAKQSSISGQNMAHLANFGVISSIDCIFAKNRCLKHCVSEIA
jgi:hypothetical protein